MYTIIIDYFPTLVFLYLRIIFKVALTTELVAFVSTIFLKISAVVETFLELSSLGTDVKSSTSTATLTAF